MPTARKLPSGSWRCQVFSHSEPLFDNAGNPVIDPKTGKQKQKRIYESFTSDDTTKFGKKEAELMAIKFAANKSVKKQLSNYTVNEAISAYINKRLSSLSPKTLSEYKKIQKNAFQCIMNKKVRTLTKDDLQIALNQELARPNKKATKNPLPLSAKTVLNEYGLLAAAIKECFPIIDTNIVLPKKTNNLKNLPKPEVIFNIVKGTDIELPVLLAMWLSFSMSEIRGLKRSSIHGDYIAIEQVIVDVDSKPIEKKEAKTFTRNRIHKLPSYLRHLIDNLPEEQEYLITMSGIALNRRFTRLVKKHGINMTFHDLRHINASVMALLRIPDKYAMERGGWKTDFVMKNIYTHTFTEERETIDKKIDVYFDGIINNATRNTTQKK